MTKRCIIIYFLFASVFHVIAQTDIEIRGDAEYKTGNYQAAFKYYNEAVKTDSANISLWYKMGESARRYHNYILAFQCYKTVYENDTDSKFSETLFWMAELSRNLSDYVMAKAYYTLYLEQNNNDLWCEEKAMEQLNNFDKTEKLLKDTTSSILIEHLSLPVNSPFSEFGGFQQGEKILYFTSVQPILSERENGLLGNSFLSAIYVSYFTTMGLSRPTQLSEPINSKTKHTANICLNEDETEMWFNRCEMTGEYKYRCDIFNSKLINNKWTNPEKLSINLENYTSTQPYYFVDSSKNEILLFSSDRPGGYGKLDIWFSVRKDGKYSIPTNLGSIINSKGNEITPFYDTESGNLYFSSDWYYGLGGYDIFYSHGSFSDWEKPKNIGYPISSAANDFYFNINSTDRDGYFTSNREGSYYLKGETCCNDLYAFYDSKNVKTDTTTNIKEEVIVVENKLINKIEELLPLDLYFHNDIPDPRSRDTVATTSYDETYYSYISLIDRYKKEYSKGLGTEESFKAKAGIELFFLEYVINGFKKLLEFTPLMKEDLEAGSSVTIKVQGFCSPLTGTEYNINLAKRRISSLINYFIKVDGGFFEPFLKGKAPNGGRLNIMAEPIGEALASPFVSDNPNDMRNSIYSVSAALERRIQIVSYESDYKGEKKRNISGPLLNLSSNDIKISLDDTVKCYEVFITNTGDEALEIESLKSAQQWISANLKHNTIIPGNVAVLNICINRDLINKPSLGVLIINSNSLDKQSVIYLRVK